MNKNQKTIKQLKIEYNQLILKHDWRTALKIIETMISLHPCASFFYKRGGVYLKLRKNKKAIKDFEYALKLDPGFHRARKVLARIEELLLKTKSPDEDISQEITVAELIELFSPTPANLNKVKRKTQTNISLMSTKNRLSSLGRYQIIDEIGRGGMGMVFKAYDTELERIVALKVLLEKDQGQEQHTQRFLREAKATARLHHQNIVALHDINRHQELTFYTMDFIKGVSLKTYIIQNPTLSVQTIISLLLPITEAVHYAHTQGIIHRDLKPANIMIDEENNPLVMDFGLAKIINVEDDLSRSGDQMGTPAYMSPEQASGSKVDFRTDIYALGTILYQMLTGRPPFQGENYYNIFFQIIKNDPVLPRRLNPDIPLDLEAICLKCLEKKASKRYISANQLVQDLGNFRDHLTIIARPATSLVLMKKFFLRHFTLVISGLIIFLTILIGATVALYQWRQAVTQRELATTAQYRAQVGEKKATIRLTKIALAKAKEKAVEEEWRNCGILAGTALKFIKGHKGKEFSNLRIQGQQLVQVALDNEGLLWQTPDFGVAPFRFDYSPGKTLKDEPAPLYICYAPDGKTIVSGCWNGTVPGECRKP